MQEQEALGHWLGRLGGMFVPWSARDRAIALLTATRSRRRINFVRSWMAASRGKRGWFLGLFIVCADDLEWPAHAVYEVCLRNLVAAEIDLVSDADLEDARAGAARLGVRHTCLRHVAGFCAAVRRCLVTMAPPYNLR